MYGIRIKKGVKEARSLTLSRRLTGCQAWAMEEGNRERRIISALGCAGAYRRREEAIQQQA
jgi:hypothetical protein